MKVLGPYSDTSSQQKRGQSSISKQHVPFRDQETKHPSALWNFDPTASWCPQVSRAAQEMPFLSTAQLLGPHGVTSDAIYQCLGTATNLGILCILIIIQYIIKIRKGKKDFFIAALYPLGISSTICSAVELKSPKCFGSGTEVSFRAIVSCSIKFQPKESMGNELNSFWDPFNPHYGQFLELETGGKN